MLQLFDAVALLRPRLDLGLDRGQVGSVVEIHGDGEAIEVEFSDDLGQTYATVTCQPTELLRLVHEASRVA
jgi:Domain of unknown function (DUF4926)